MRTNTAGFEELFYERLQALLDDEYPALELHAPISGSSFGALTPDFVVSNPRTGASLAVRVKSGFQAAYIPLSTLPLLHELREQVRSARGSASDLVLITTGELPNIVKRGLAHDGIAFFEVDTPMEAAERMTSQLHQLQSPIPPPER